jgi:ribosomal protein S18 acetylase RimI-like enzyme
VGEPRPSLEDTALGRVTLRPAQAEDRELLLSVYAATRAEELDQVVWPEGAREAFLRMQFDLQDTEYRRINPEGSFDVVEVDGRPAGRLYVDRRPEEIRVVDVALLPQFRGAGIGGALLTGLQEEAAASGRRVTIHVEVTNPAARLYERLGFVVVADLGLYRRMEWTP